MFQKKTIEDHVYEEILKKIVELTYAPGEKLSETKLVAELGVSRTPIKNAFARLETEGFVEIRPQRGTFVSQISQERMLGICEIREMLEVKAVRTAVKRVTQAQLDELESLFKKLETMEEGSEEKKLLIYQTDGLLHNFIYEASGNPVIAEIINRYKPDIQRIQRSNYTWDGRKTKTLVEMRKIFTALKERDESKAAAAMAEHIQNIKLTCELKIKNEEDLR